MSEDRRQGRARCDYGNPILLAAPSGPNAEDVDENLLHFADPRILVRAETEPDGRAVGSVRGSRERAFGTIVAEQARDTGRDVEDGGNATPSLRGSPNPPVHNFQPDIVFVLWCRLVAEDPLHINGFIA